MNRQKLKVKTAEVKATMDGNSQMAADLLTLLNALPKGQVKQLMKDETCGAILGKYGITAQ